MTRGDLVLDCELRRSPQLEIRVTGGITVSASVGGRKWEFPRLESFARRETPFQD